MPDPKAEAKKPAPTEDKPRRRLRGGTGWGDHAARVLIVRVLDAEAKRKSETNG